MKSNFALSLSFDGLRLLHRVAGGWDLVGEVALDDPDLTGSLARLHTVATGLEPAGLRTKLLIPNDQIRYLALDTTRADDADVRAALDGATPYAVDDLAYDFTVGGGRTYIAAVARETLDEARAFAIEHGFNPTDYAAVPEPFTFVGEANFGGVDGSEALREDAPVIITGTAPAAARHDTPEPIQKNPVQNNETVQPDSPDEGGSGFVQADEEPTVSLPEPAAPIAAELEPDTPHPEEDVQIQAPPVFASRLRAQRSETGVTAGITTGITTGAGLTAQKSEKSNSPDRPKRAEPSVVRQAIPRDTPPVLPELAVPTQTGPNLGPALFAQLPDATQTGTAPPLPGQTSGQTPPPPVTEGSVLSLSETAAIAAASLTAPRRELSGAGRDAAAGQPSGAVDTSAGHGGMFASRRSAKADTASAQGSADTADTAKTSIFGARKKPDAKPVVGGKPRFLGLILTAVLLLFLLAIAAFAALSEDGLAGWFRGADPVQTATALPDAKADSTADVTDSTDTASATLIAATPTPIIPTGAEILTTQEAERIYAATGVWQKAPRIPLIPRTTSLDGMMLDVTARPVTRVPASPLPRADSVAGDSLIAVPVNPPAPSVIFDFDDRGLVVATAQGAMTPDGIVVTAGRPPVNPPTRPGTIAPEITVLDQLASVLPEGAVPAPDAPEGVILIAGAPSLLPPVRPVLANAPVGSVRPEEGLPATATQDPTADVTAGLAMTQTENLAERLVEGLNVVAGAPPLLPPVRPAAPSTYAPAGTDLEGPAPEGFQTDGSLTEGSETNGAAPPQPAPTLRPLIRPETVVPAAAGIQDTPVLDSAAQLQAVSLRPRTRPEGIAPAPEPEAAIVPAVAPVPPQQQAAPVLQIAPEIAAAVAQAAARPDPFATATPLAIANSLRPDTRPRNMDRIVARATDARQRATTQVAAVAPRAAAPTATAPTTTVAPSGPTGASVAQNATLQNAINLRELNLIGIYGSSGDRRALVRLANGRYQRVTVGDTLDGGRVTAIGANALNYTKRGRAISLQVPG